MLVVKLLPPKGDLSISVNQGYLFRGRAKESIIKNIPWTIVIIHPTRIYCPEQQEY